MSNYFRNFPKVDYRFGNETTMTQFQHLGTYVDIIDQVKDYAVFYETYSIENGERADALSYKLYQNVNHYWTFYLLNDHLRTNGWPIRDADLFNKAQQYYPNSVSMTYGVIQKKGPSIIEDGNNIYVQWRLLNETLPLCKSTSFKKGSYVYFSSSKTVGQILNIDQKLGAITHNAPGVRNASIDRTMETISAADYEMVKADSEHIPRESYELIEIYNNYDEFDAPHHYEDVNGNWIWPEWAQAHPNGLDPSSLNSVKSVSNFERLTDLNQNQKVISVIKQDSIAQIVSEFNRLLQFG